jgi:hypothetical protein
MRKRFVRRTALGLLAGVAAAVAVAGMGSVASAVAPAGAPASASQYEKKVTICHRTGPKRSPRFHTIRVSRNAVPAHLKHGDALGPCGSAVFTVCHKTKGGKHQTLKLKGAAKTKRHLKKGDKLGKCNSKGKPEKTKGKQKGKEKNKGHGKKGGGPKKP